jgi:hypothetical protein
MSNEEVNSLYKCTVCEYHALHKGSRETGGSAADRIFFMKYLLSFLEQKISNSRLVQVYMSKQPGMDAQKVLEHQYITAETLYKTYIREANDVVQLPTPQMLSVSETRYLSFT